jgi:mannose-6-phosphate isomerase-like protein (cupin superfamily)
MRIVEKPWGREEIWAETDRYVGKYLHINSGHRLSLQYHKNKMETIRVISGELILETANGVIQVLKQGDTFHVSPGTIHRFGAGENEGVVLVEVSTPELDDVIRISDDYLRDNT